jgi:hypothetical protein
MPPERGCADGIEIATRVVERLTPATIRSATAGAATGLGLWTPVKPMFPKDLEASGACAADGTTAAVDAVALTSLVGVAAEAGRASEATIAPEMTIAAEAWVAGLIEREITDNRDVWLNWHGARRKPKS